MPVNTRELMSVVQQLAENENLRVTVKESAKGALFTGGCALIGGIIGGPVGLGIGGTIGAVSAAVQGLGKYKSVAHVIINDMTAAQREKLARSIVDAFKDVNPNDLLFCVMMYNSDPSVKARLLMTIIGYLRNELGLHVMQGQ